MASSEKSGSSSFKLKVVLFNVIPVTGTNTLIVDVAVNPPSVVIAVMVAVPAVLPVTTPVSLTVAIVESEDDQVTFVRSVTGLYGRCKRHCTCNFQVCAGCD